MGTGLVAGKELLSAQWVGTGRGQRPSLVLEVPDSLAQGDGDKLQHCRWDTGKMVFLGSVEKL